ncbi:MAG: hypothetical protein H7329_00210 [Opitutaceae bacterium]|nr:hypothetical protein [Cytophagales bacterium]
MRNPYLQILFFSVVVFAATYLYQTIYNNLPFITWFALAYYFLLTATVHAITFPAFKNNSKAFISIFMGSQGLRMFFSIALLIVYLIFTPIISIQFVVYFLFLYLLFAAFEIYLLLSNLRTDFKKGSIHQ